jgi:hypothetical protein
VTSTKALQHQLTGKWLYLGLFLLWAVVLIWLNWDTILTREGWDPDDQLRLVQLRDFLSGQSWFDTTQYRMNAPEGAPMHWSRLIELPLASVVLIATPLLGPARAEIAAGIIVPMFCFGGIAFLLAQVAGKIAGRPAAIAAFVLALIAPAMLLQLRPMRIDHHGWQIFCAVLGFATLYLTDVRKAGLVLGAALAVWIHISLEGAPMTAAFFLYLGWRWIMDAAEGRRLFWTLCSFATGSAALFFGTQSAGLSAPNFCDTVSPVHILAIFAATAILLPAVYANPQNRFARAGVNVFAGVSALAILFWMVPRCSAGAFGDLDPIVSQFWYANIMEGLPVWYQDRLAAITLLSPLAVALIASYFAYRFVHTADRPMLGQLGFFLIYASILSLLVFRTVSVATAFAIVPTALCLAAIVRRYRIEPIFIRRMGLVGLGLILMIPGPIAAILVQAVAGSSRTEAKAEAVRDAAQAKCESATSVQELSRLPTGNIVAPFDLGPTILLTTKHNVLASSHHRNRRGMRDQIDIFRLRPEQARPILIRHNIAYLVACPGEGELTNYLRKSPGGLWAQIDADKAPAWLEYQGTMGKGLKVWRVR